MSIPVLIQVYDEVRRLAIAGSVVAPGDFRLKKLVPQLEQAGQKVPVFAKVGEAVNRLVGSTEKTSAPALLELTTLVNAILYTQGETGIEGDMAPLKSVELGRLKTQSSARVLKPLQEALTTTGSGRIEIIRDAFEGGAFHDLRMILPSLAALDDPYPEIADFVANKILPLYGQAIIPELETTFDPKGRGGHVRRLLLMNKLDSEAARAHIQRSLDDGSKEVRVAAIGCLGDSADDLAFLLEQVKAKAKDVRTAALNALGKSGSNDAAKILCDALANADLPLAIEPLRTSRNALVTNAVLDTAEKQFALLMAGEEKNVKKLGEQNERMILLLECLRGRDGARTEKLMLGMFDEAESLAKFKGQPGGKDVVEKLVTIMAWGPPDVKSALIDAHSTLPAESLGRAFIAARLFRTPEEVFAMFSPYLTAKVNEKKKNSDPAYAKREVIVQSLLSGRRGLFRRNAPDDFALTGNLGSQWLDLALNLGRLDLVQALAVCGHARTNALLAEAFQHSLSKPDDDRELLGILDTMIRVGHPNATDAAIDLINQSAKVGSRYSHYWIARMIPRLPTAEALPKLEALLPTLPEKIADELVAFVTQLK